MMSAAMVKTGRPKVTPVKRAWRLVRRNLLQQRCECQRCEHVWFAAEGVKPVTCPKCGRRNWDAPAQPYTRRQQ